VDPLTHGLATLALQRGVFPKASWRGIIAILCAGLVADCDFLSANFGPSAYLRWNRTATHSIAFILVLAFTAFLFSLKLRNHPRASGTGFSWAAIAAAATLHILMDVLQAHPIAPFWPFSARRFSFDVLPAIDPWLLVILAAAILLPELFRLVSDEIGSRAKRQRGRYGAIAGLAFAMIYLAMRAQFHGNVTASLEARTVSGEIPRRVAAFPDSVSPFLWHSVVETDSALSLSTQRSMGGEVSYATGVTTLRKPEPSAALSAAQSSPAAITFLKSARFPKATVEQETEGFSVEINDLKDQAMQTSSHAIFADIVIDKNSSLLSSELQWQRAVRHP
jgi:inner membrane protein